MCRICHKDCETQNLDVPVNGSEGLQLCESCRSGALSLLRKIQAQCQGHHAQPYRERRLDEHITITLCNDCWRMACVALRLAQSAGGRAHMQGYRDGKPKRDNTGALREERDRLLGVLYHIAHTGHDHDKMVAGREPTALIAHFRKEAQDVLGDDDDHQTE